MELSTPTRAYQGARSLNKAASKSRLKHPKVVYLQPRAVAYTTLQVATPERDDANESEHAVFLRDFQAVVAEEVQKSSNCVALIQEDIRYHRTELQMLRKQLHLETSQNERSNMQAHIAKSKGCIATFEEHIFLIEQRVALLQEQVSVLYGEKETV